MIKINTINKREEGFASIVIALTMIIVLALLVVGFAQLARREQQSALDKQLSAQAYYAAETGINDVRKLIDNGTIDSVPNINTNQCLKGAAIDSTKNINTSTGVAYTCVIANLLPTELKFQGILPDTSKVTNFQTTDAVGSLVPLSSLRIEWTTEGAAGPPSGSDTPLLPLSQWTTNRYPSVIQFALTPYNSTNAPRETLIGNTSTTYLYPAHSASSLSYSATKGTGSGAITKATCTGNKCAVTMTGISNAGIDNYLLQLTNLYAKADISITGKDTSGNSVHFKGAQAMVDVTGKARNVLKRLQVRIPLDTSKNLPGYALEAQNICKRLEATPNNTTFNTSGLAGTSTEQSSCNVSAN